MSHPNDMSQWDEIKCRQDHAHHTIPARVVLGGAAGHGYHDYPPIPYRFARAIDLWVWDWERYHASDHEGCADAGYCPARDVVSETLATLNVWEPIESILVLSALSAATKGSFVDIGAQIGWFSALAASCGRSVLAIEADAEVADLCKTNVPTAFVERGRIGIDTFHPPPYEILLAKIDVEGAEPAAVDWLWARIEAGDVEHLLVEISPVFHDGYPDLVCRLIEVGYEAYSLPEKRTPPWPLDVLPRDLLASSGLLHTWNRTALRDWIAGQHQFNAWFCRPGAVWA